MGVLQAYKSGVTSMNQNIKNILHDMKSFRDEINCCYTCVAEDYRRGDKPQEDDINDLKKASLELSRLVENLALELKGKNHETK